MKQALIRALLSKTIAYKKVYSDIMGDVPGGVWLSQVVYWSQRSTGYFYKSKTEWEEETGLTERQTRRIEKIAEKLTGVPHFNVESRATDWGMEHEDEAITEYEKITGEKVRRLAKVFIKFNDFSGGSPDGFIGDEKIIEIKCP